jgi:hypothetical protein
VPVGLRALTARINRLLKNEGRVLKRARGLAAAAELGEHYLVDLHRNRVAAKYVDIERLARERELLADWEELANPSTNAAIEG